MIFTWDALLIAGAIIVLAIVIFWRWTLIERKYQGLPASKE